MFGVGEKPLLLGAGTVRPGCAVVNFLRLSEWDSREEVISGNATADILRSRLNFVRLRERTVQTSVSEDMHINMLKLSPRQRQRV